MTLISVQEAAELFNKSQASIRVLINKDKLQRHTRKINVGGRPRLFVNLVSLVRSAQNRNWYVPTYMVELADNTDDIRVVLERYAPHLLG
jgi:hypothetical protein